MRCFLLFAALAFTLISCEGSLKSADPTSLTVSKDVIYISADAGLETFEVDASANWSIDGVPDWCGSVVPSYGRAGKYNVRVRGRFYEDFKDRSANLSVVCGSEIRNVHLVQYGCETFTVDIDNQSIPSIGGTVKVSVFAESAYKVTIENGGEWLKLKTTPAPIKGDLYFEASANVGEERTAVIVFSIPERGFRKEIEIIQLSHGTKNRYTDGQVIEKLLSTRDKSINIIILGDGFIKEDLQHGGAFDSMVNRTVSALFSCEPMASYKDYFNVYAVAAESAERGTGVVSARNTALQTYFMNEFGVTMNLNENAAYTYMEKTGITDKLSTILIVLVNTTKTGGVTITWNDGRCISLCTDAIDSGQLEGLVRHEVIGHSIGKLDEEYMYMSGYVTDEFIQSLREKHSRGFSLNIDTTIDRDEIAWKHFFNVDGYEKVGCYWFEGGCVFSGGGVCKSEDAPSCMANNSAYFDAPSREQIVKHIKGLVGEEYDFEQFIAEDKLRYQ